MHTIRRNRGAASVPCMSELKTLVPKTDRHLPAGPHSRNSQEPKQRRMMVTALTLLLIALGFVLYRDRDFWFPDTQEAQETAARPQSTAPAITSAQPQSKVTKKQSTTRKLTISTKPPRKTSAPTVEARGDDAPADRSAPPITAITSRTVLPPLEVEVVAGDTHRTLHPGANSVRVDLQAGSPPMGASQAPSPGDDGRHSSQRNQQRGRTRANVRRHCRDCPPTGEA